MKAVVDGFEAFSTRTSGSVRYTYAKYQDHCAGAKKALADKTQLHPSTTTFRRSPARG
jgi:hypothetical protein